MADDSASAQGTPSPSPPPCSKGCGFFGSPSTMNMCSKCFREHQRSNPPAQDAGASAAAPSAAAAAPPAAAATAPAFAPAVRLPAQQVQQQQVQQQGAAAAAAAAASADPTAPPPRKVQKNTSRCFSCRKKIGLTGFKCHCDYYFCSEHRYSDKHDCDFDYQASAREQLEKANPVVVASKLEKI